MSKWKTPAGQEEIPTAIPPGKSARATAPASSVTHAEAIANHPPAELVAGQLEDLAAFPGQLFGAAAEEDSPRRVNITDHARRCAVCRHSRREAIEDDFLHWRNPARIAEEFNLPGRHSIHRHARALDLFTQRRRNLRCVLESILERADRATVTADAVIRAARAYSQINDSGEWIEPPRSVIVSPSPALSSAPRRPAPDAARVLSSEAAPPLRLPAAPARYSKSANRKLLPRGEP